MLFHIALFTTDVYFFSYRTGIVGCLACEPSQFFLARMARQFFSTCSTYIFLAGISKCGTSILLARIAHRARRTHQNVRNVGNVDNVGHAKKFDT